MNDLFRELKYIARKYHARWRKIDDALALLRATDDGGRSAEGEKSRRLLANAFRVSTYPDSTRKTLETDRANALKALAKPLREALGNIVTIELADMMLRELDLVELERRVERDQAAHEERDGTYGPLIQKLHEHGVVRGHYTALTNVELAAIARFIQRKAAHRVAGLKPLRTDRETRGSDGRGHTFWDPYHVPRD